MTIGTIPPTLREAIEDARNLLFDEKSGLSATDVLRVIADICIEARVVFESLPPTLVGMRFVAEEWIKKCPARQFERSSLIEALNRVLVAH